MHGWKEGRGQEGIQYNLIEYNLSIMDDTQRDRTIPSSVDHPMEPKNISLFSFEGECIFRAH